MRIFFGVLLIVIAVCGGALWSARAAMTTEAGICNATTWTVMAVAALGLIPAGASIYLLARAVAAIGR